MEKDIHSKSDYSVIGNITQDLIAARNGVVKRDGGSAYFISKTLLSLGNTVDLYTNADTAVDIYSNPRLRKYGQVSPVVEVFIDEEIGRAQINYPGERIDPDVVPQHLYDADCTVVAATFSEIDKDGVRLIRQKQPHLAAVDIQGFMRRLDPVDGVRKEAIEIDIFKGYDVIKMNMNEAAIQFGTSPLDKAADELQKLGIAVCLFTLGSEGAVIYAEDAYTIPAESKDVQFTVGAGDVFLAAFLHNYVGNDSARNAAAAAASYASEYLIRECS